MARSRRPLFGQIVEDAEPASRDILQAGDSQLARDRATLHKALTADSTVARKELLSAEAALQQRVARALRAPTGLRRARGGFTRDNTRLTVAGRQAMERAIRRGMQESFRNIDSLVESRVLKSVERSIRIQERRLQSMGFSKLTRDQRRVIDSTVRELLDEEFPPGSGLSYRARLARIQQQRTQQLYDIVRRTYPDGYAAERISQDLNRAMTHYRPGTPIRGGTAYKQVRRLLVAEETRMANAVELTTLRARDVRMAYWRLSPQHPWYGGQEVCEFLASQINGDVVRAFDEAGISTAGIALEGLYLIEDYPQYPHPFCQCFPEAFVPPDIERRLKQSQKELSDFEQRRLEARQAGRVLEASRLQRSIQRARESIEQFEPLSSSDVRGFMRGFFGLE